MILQHFCQHTEGCDNGSGYAEEGLTTFSKLHTKVYKNTDHNLLSNGSEKRERERANKCGNMLKIGDST